MDAKLTLDPVQDRLARQILIGSSQRLISEALDNLPGAT
jgi:hypothetical protein